MATWAALIVVYIVWGSAYLGIRVIVGFAPPLVAMGVRFLCAGILLAVFLVLRHGPAILRVPPRRALSAAMVGVLLLTGGNGGVAVAEQTVPSGLAALLVAASTYEMLAAGAMFLVMGAATGEFGKVHSATIPVRAWVALAYLIVFGSLAAFPAYVWLLGNAPLSLTATYAYVNPIVAVMLGALILGEKVTWPILIGGAVVVAGVGLVVSVERPRRRAAHPPSPARPRPAGPRASAKPSMRP